MSQKLLFNPLTGRQPLELKKTVCPRMLFPLCAHSDGRGAGQGLLRQSRAKSDQNSPTRSRIELLNQFNRPTFQTVCVPFSLSRRVGPLAGAGFCVVHLWENCSSENFKPVRSELRPPALDAHGIREPRIIIRRFRPSDYHSPSPGGEGRGEGGISSAEARGSEQLVHGEVRVLVLAHDHEALVMQH
jgi:hypothetical protein